MYHTHLDIQRLPVRKTAWYARCRWTILQIEQSNKCFYPTRTAITLSWSLLELQPAIRTLGRRLVDGVQMFHLQKTAQKQKKHGKRSFESFCEVNHNHKWYSMNRHDTPWDFCDTFMIVHDMSIFPSLSDAFLGCQVAISPSQEAATERCKAASKMASAWPCSTWRWCNWWWNIGYNWWFQPIKLDQYPLVRVKI